MGLQELLSMSSQPSEEDGEELEKLAAELERQRQVNRVLAGRQAGLLLEDPLLKGFLQESQTALFEQLKRIPLDAPANVILGLRAYLQAVCKLEENLKGLQEQGKVSENILDRREADE